MSPRVWICILVIPYMVMWASASMTNSELRDEIKATGKTLFRALRDSAMDCSVKCKSRKPRIMCGSDGVSYTSKCEVKRARRCEGKKITIKKKGKCSDHESKCFQEKEDAEATMNGGGSTEAFIPDCNEDGTYAEIQCHYANGSRYCWCVSSDGRPVINTSTKDDKPSCNTKTVSVDPPPPLYTSGNKNRHLRPNKKDKKRRKQKKTKTKRCSFKERTRFNTNLVRVFTEEYNRMASSSSNKQTNGDRAPNLAEQVVEWKFSHYDDNSDSLLQRKEVNALRRLVKKFIKPRSCAKRFLKFCDNDNDKVITKREWSLCLSTDLNRKELQETTTHAPAEVKPTGESLDLNKLLNQKSSSSSSSSSKNEPNDCLTERASAIEQEMDNPRGGTFIPNCTPEGTWNKAQCHKTAGYCWCVEEDSGRPISGTSTRNVEPECDFEGERLIPDSTSVGCTFAEKQSFVADLLNTLTTEMANYALNSSTDHSILVIDPNKTLHERAAEWKFLYLDLNNNQFLENTELDNFKETLKNSQKKETRKCARKFVRYCDEDEDKKVSRQEWVDCLGVTRSSNTNLPTNPKRIGKNPFDKYLVEAK
ncbi:SPARC-related modular calcium-binding protein 1 [Mactra antiquata]